MNITNLYHKAKAALAANSTAKADANKRFIGFMVAIGMGVCTLMPDLAMAAHHGTRQQPTCWRFLQGD